MKNQNRTIVVDFGDESKYQALISKGKVLLKFLLAYILIFRFLATPQHKKQEKEIVSQDIPTMYEIVCLHFSIFTDFGLFLALPPNPIPISSKFLPSFPHKISFAVVSDHLTSSFLPIIASVFSPVWLQGSVQAPNN